MRRKPTFAASEELETAVLLYLHIPFCHRVCPYCSFYKHTPGGTPIGEFINAILAESRHRLAQCGEKPRTLYLGGGTPSMLSPHHLTQLFDGLREIVDFDKLDEVTMEANPATFDAGKARHFLEIGVRRISLGIQSFSPHVLGILGREHSAEQAAESLKILRGAGMPSINIDLMFSIPGQSEADWSDTLDRAISLKPDHVSAYNLTYEEDTAFFEALRRGEMREDEDADARLFHLADEKLAAAGFDHYETSNYARPGHQSSHNQGYWRGEDYLGLGPSAVSTISGTRSKNLSDTAGYATLVRGVGHAIVEAEPLDGEALRIERIALGLRTSEGIPLSLLHAAGLERAALFSEAGLASIRNDRLILAGKGRALVDPIAAELI